MDKSERRVSARWVAFCVSGLCAVGLMGSAGFAEEHLPVSAISSSSGGVSWFKTVDDSGMHGMVGSRGYLHDTNEANMGLSGSGAPHWVRYDLGESLPLDEMWIWNYNDGEAPVTEPAHYARGMKDIVIAYSENGATFTTIFDGQLPVAQERGEGPGLVDLVVPFNQAVARFVRITTAAQPNHNYLESEFGLGNFPEAGLSEVRFYKATLIEPSEQVNATGVVAVEVPGDAGVRYNLERATSIQPPNWQETGVFVVGSGSPATIYYAETDDKETVYYRGAAQGLEAILGVPTAENGWSTESRVSVRSSSNFQISTAQQLINGNGISADGMTHGAQRPQMWLAALFNANQRGGTVTGGHWVEFKLTEPLPVGSMQIWNYSENQDNNWRWTGLGIKSATIQYTTAGGGGPGGEWGSDNSADWTTAWQGTLAAYTPPHPPLGAFPVSDEIDFDNAMVQYVVLTASGNSADVNYASEIPQGLTLAGLAEVRFTSAVSYSIDQQSDLLTNEAGFQFQSASNSVYTLQRASTGTESYANTGSFGDGTGETMTLFDPQGYSALHDYRIVIE